MTHLYRKKPVVIEAAQFKGNAESANKICEWIIHSGGKAYDHYIGDPKKGKVVLIIETLEGAMTARKGDYVIKGIQGEFYPCKSDIFADSYELVE